MDNDQESVEDVGFMEIAGLALRFGLMVGALVQLMCTEGADGKGKGKGESAVDVDSLF